LIVNFGQGKYMQTSTYLQTKLRTRHRIQMTAAKKGIAMPALRKKLKMEKALFSKALCGDRKKAHRRIVELLESL